MTDREIYLQSLQGAISRLSGHSFVVKGWAVTIVSGLGALAITQKAGIVLALAAFPVLIFWSLDAYYLALERRYRHLFDRAFRDELMTSKEMTFQHGTHSSSIPVMRSLISPPLLTLYLALLLLLGVVRLVVHI